MAAGRLPATHSTTVPAGQASVSVDALLRSKLMPGAQCLGHRPRLCDAPAWFKRRIAIEDLGDRSEPVVTEMMRQWREERSSRLGVTVHLEVCQRERAEEEGPHRSLVIGGIAVRLIATIVTPVLRMAGGETSKPVGRQQAASASVDDLARASPRQRALRK